MRGELQHHLANAIDAPLPLFSEKIAERLRLRIDKVAEHVDIALLGYGRHLDADDKFEALLGTRLRGIRATGNRVVIGHRQHGDARPGGAGDQLRGRELPVGSGRMCVQVDQWAVRAAGIRFEALRRPRRSRNL